MKAYIRNVSYYLPELVVTNEDIVKDFPDWTAAKIELKIGIKKRYLCGDLTAADLAERAANLLFEQNNIDRGSIDALLLCTQSPDYFLPTTACILQHKLGLPQSVAAFDFNLGCSGFVYGLGIAKGMICAGVARNILLLMSETYSKYIHQNDRGNRTLFSDAASATLVSTNGFAEIGDFVLGTDGSGFNNLIVETGANRIKEKKGIEIDDKKGITRSPDYLFMDGPAIFNFSLEVVPRLINEVLERNHLKLEEIGLFIFHQANKHLLKFIREAIQIPEDKFYVCLENFGNTVSSTIPIALFNALKENRIMTSDNVILTGFGVGYSWGSVNLIIK
jgi:3-oxoacyl-[acyl-carrier-protein] synthase III